MKSQMLTDAGYGIVVTPNDKYSPLIEVFPISEIPDIGGDISAYTTQITSEAGNVTMKAKTIVTWINLYEPNRITAPAVFEHDVVRLQRFKGTDTLIWTPLIRNAKIARQEAAIYSWSNIPSKEDGVVDETKSVWFEVNTIDGYIHLSTPDNAGEKAKFNITWDMIKGNLSIDLDNKNSLLWESVPRELTLNVPSKVTVNTTNSIVNASSSAVIKTKHATVDSPTTDITGNTNIGGNINIKGSLKCSGSGRFSGALRAATTPYS